MVSMHRSNRFIEDLSLPLQEAWRSSQTLLSKLVERLDVPIKDASPALFLMSQKTDNPLKTQREFANQMTAGEQVTVIAGSSADGKTQRIIMVPTKGVLPKNSYLAPFVEIHSRLIAWWLTTAWRCLDLAQSTWELSDANRTISAAACSRSLLETTAAFWCDARKLTAMWREMKRRGITDKSAWQDRHDLNIWMWRTTYGSKFDDRVPDLARASEWLSRTNVMGFIDKLHESLPNMDLHTHYQWLCNTVHPSCGGTFAMSTPHVNHVSNTHAFVWFAPFPTRIESGGKDVSQRCIQEAIATASIIAVRVAVQALDDSIRVIDDFGLTTGAPKIATFEYWRKLEVKTRKQLCPCRSGLTFEKCGHRWGEPAASITSSFPWDTL